MRVAKKSERVGVAKKSEHAGGLRESTEEERACRRT